MTRRITSQGVIILCATLILACVASSAAIAQVHVRGYYRKDGTYVRPHVRSNPDGDFANNWSTKGNVNPYTGEEGTRVTPPTGYGDASGSGFYTSGSDGSTSDFGASTSANTSSAWIANPFHTGQTPNLRSSAEPNDRANQLAAFNYHGIGFSTSHDEFLKIFPQAKPASPADSRSVVSYAIEDIDNKCDTVWFQFLDNRFLCLGFTYKEDRVRKIGGASALIENAKRTFGPPTSEEAALTAWQFPEIDRSVRAGWDGSNWCLLITGNTAQEQPQSEQTGIERNESSPQVDQIDGSSGHPFAANTQEKATTIGGANVDRAAASLKETASVAGSETRKNTVPEVENATETQAHVAAPWVEIRRERLYWEPTAAELEAMKIESQAKVRRNESTSDTGSNDYYIRELKDIDQELRRRQYSSDPSDSNLSDLRRRLERTEKVARSRVEEINRRPGEAGYSKEVRRAATFELLIKRGYDPHEARLTVDAMDEQGLLPDPPRH